MGLRRLKGQRGLHFQESLVVLGLLLHCFILRRDYSDFDAIIADSIEDNVFMHFNKDYN